MVWHLLTPPAGMTAAIVFHGMRAIYTRFTVSIQSRHVLSSDIADNIFYPLLPLPAVWTQPGHDFV